jgi:tetratricopeptide (TPR) repeat protein
MVHNTLGSIAFESADLERAQHHYEQSLKFRRRAEDHPGVAASLNNLATLAERRGDIVQAEHWYSQSLAQLRTLGDRCGIASALHNLARLAKAAKENQRATSLVTESLDLRRELGDQNGIAMSLSLLSNLACEGGQLNEAKILAQQAVDLWKEIGSAGGVVRGHCNLADIHILMDDYALAANHYRHAVKASNARGDLATRGLILMSWGNAALCHGEPSDAIACFLKARRIFWKLLDLKSFGTTMRHLSELYRVKGLHRRAEWCGLVADRVSREGHIDADQTTETQFPLNLRFSSRVDSFIKGSRGTVQARNLIASHGPS